MPEKVDYPIAASKIETIHSLLLNWYYTNGRNLPWRGESSAYRVWVSEVMLQQTQVSTVIPYYERFFEKFSTVEILAEASLNEVLKAWEGLGYYARARNLHKAAAEIVDKWNGQLPSTYADLRTLPGFGDYTAGAVASVIFGQAVPAVDGNVKRVLARLFAIREDITKGSGAKQVKEYAAALVSPDKPGDWSQAMMELGALVCVPKSPNCAECPVEQLCAGKAAGIECNLPVKPVKKALPHYDVAAAVIYNKEQLLIAQRPLDGMLGGLWEFPGGKQEPGETLPECLQREIDEELGVKVEVGDLITTVKHSYTHFKITLHAFTCKITKGVPQPIGVADWCWIMLDDIDDYPFPRTDLKIIKALRNQSEA